MNTLFSLLSVCSYLKGQQADECSKALCGHETNAITGVTHTAQHWYYEQHNVGYNVHIQLLHDTWRDVGQGHYCTEITQQQLQG